MIQFKRGKAFCVGGDTSIEVAIKRMIEKGYSSVLVYDETQKIVGIFTERDVLRKMSTLRVDVSLDRPIRTLMTPSVHFAHEGSLLADVKRLHKEKKIRHFPVLVDGGKPILDDVVGVVTLADFGRAAFE